MAPDGGDSGAGDGVSAQGDEGVYGSISDTFGNNNAPDANASFADNAGWGGIGVDASDPFGDTSAFGNLGGFGVDASPGIGDVAGKVGSFLEGRVQAAIDDPVATLANLAFGLVPVAGQINTGLGLVGAPTFGSGVSSIASSIFGETAPPSDPNAAFADAAGIGGIGNNTSYGDPSMMGMDSSGGMYRDPQNAQIAQAISSSAPSLFPQPQQQQAMLWQPNQWNGNQMAIPGIRFA